MKAGCDYTYAVSRIKAMENRIVDATTMQQMADADGFDNAWKLLMETCYGQWSVEIGTSSYDKLLEVELVYLYDELNKFVPDSSIVSLFQIPYDFHNMKVVLKSLFAQRGGGESRWDLLVSMGSYPTDEMILAIESEDYRLLPYQLHSVIPSCIAIWEQTKNILEIENILDRHMFRVMCLIADDIPFSGVKKYVRLRIDGENIRTMLRLKRLNAAVPDILDHLHPGGTFSLSFLTQLYPEPVESWSKALSFAYMGAVLSDIEKLEGTQVLPEVERRLDRLTTSYLDQYQYDPFAPEQVVRYLWLKEIEVCNLRIILVGKASGVEKDMIKGLLRHAA